MNTVEEAKKISVVPLSSACKTTNIHGKEAVVINTTDLAIKDGVEVLA